jgi:hypothetical protein
MSNGNFPWEVFIAGTAPMLVAIINIVYQFFRDKQSFDENLFARIYDKRCDVVSGLYESFTPVYVKCIKSNDYIELCNTLNELITVLQDEFDNKSVFMGVEGYDILRDFIDSLVEVINELTIEGKSLPVVGDAVAAQKFRDSMDRFNKEKLNQYTDKIGGYKEVVGFLFMHYLENPPPPLRVKTKKKRSKKGTDKLHQ